MSYSPPKEVKIATRLGLDLRKHHGVGGSPIDIARAQMISDGENIPVPTLSRMARFFTNHSIDEAAKSDDNPEWITWNLWGGNAAKAWVLPLWEKVQGETMAVKAGSRHNSNDRNLLKQAAIKIDELENILEQLGMNDGDDGDPATNVPDIQEANPNDTLPVGSAVITDNAKAISLDETIDNVRSSFYKQFPRANSYDMSSPDYSYVQSVYEGYIIVKCGMCYMKVTYTTSKDAITFADKNSWQQVETEWALKAIPDFDLWVHSVKAIDEDRIGHYLVIWGNKDRKDLQGEWFTPKTEDMFNIFNAVGKIPTLYHHGADKTIGSEVVGLYDTLIPDDIGIWAESQLEKASKYKDTILKLVKSGALGSSSGAVPASRKVNKSGEIERWTLAEGSLSPSPIEWRQRIDYPVSVLKAIYTESGLDFPYKEQAVDTKAVSEKGSEVKTVDASQENEERERMRLRMQLEKAKLEAGIQ